MKALYPTLHIIELHLIRVLRLLTGTILCVRKVDNPLLYRSTHLPLFFVLHFIYN